MLEIVTRKSTSTGDTFHVQLLSSPGVEHADGAGMATRDVHPIRLVFTRFYPDVPIECYVDAPLFHPNVRPETGFVCLWEQANPRDTAIQAIARAQAMAAFRMVNMGGAHLMNKPAGEWYETVAVPRQPGAAHVGRTARLRAARTGRCTWLEPGRSLIPRAASRLR